MRTNLQRSCLAPPEPRRFRTMTILHKCVAILLVETTKRKISSAPELHVRVFFVHRITIFHRTMKRSSRSPALQRSTPFWLHRKLSHCIHKRRPVHEHPRIRFSFSHGYLFRASHFFGSWNPCEYQNSNSTQRVRGMYRPALVGFDGRRYQRHLRIHEGLEFIWVDRLLLPLPAIIHGVSRHQTTRFCRLVAQLIHPSGRLD